MYLTAPASLEVEVAAWTPEFTRGAALIAVAAWIPLLSDGFSDPGFVIVLFGLLGGLGLGWLLTGAIAQGILVARANQHDQQPAQ